jgi:hypothetical protein
VNVRLLAQALYGLFGVTYFAAGAGVLAYRTGLLPVAVTDLILGVAGGDLNTVHVMQEFGTHLLAAGVLALWFAWNYERSWAFQWAMTAGWGAFALVHWFDVRGPIRSLGGPLVNSVPFLLFAAVGLLRWRTERRATQAAG